MIGVEVKGLRAAQVYTSELSKGIRHLAGEVNFRKAVAVQRAWQAWVSGPRSRARIHSHGRYRQGIRAVREGQDGVVGTRVEYARIHELGGKTKPHVIEPRRAKVLAFKIGGEMRFAKRVNHPGSRIPARPSMAPALHIAEPAMRKLDEGHWDEAARLANEATAGLNARFEKLSDLVRQTGVGLREAGI